MNGFHFNQRFIFLLTFLFLTYSGLLRAREKGFTFGNPPTRWHIKHSRKPKAPGPNLWSARKSNVFLDERGFLHLKTTPSSHGWKCAEVFTDYRFGYGEYTFYLIGNFTRFHPQLVLGLFLYRNDHSEIDIEFSRWGKSRQDSLGMFTIHWRDSLGTDRKISQKFPVHLSGDNPYVTFKIKWFPDSVIFQGYRGHYPQLPSPGALIAHASLHPFHTVADNSPKKIVMNLYWYRGKSPAPETTREYEIIIRDVWFRPFSTEELRESQ